ncbi:hypothetical protein E2562_013014 [Oryza meyeriana var. granulata]|uniref:Pectinesterase inhibitor domain-containing protein n=1 Tax=Oryza meyeriana var. granulata TaxID=110450 RepID=A0A6G1DI81_9ORYZ|nr:hypothetical protein E2562_013014 [Oryza meyeriana var. granulata]
MLQLPTTTDTTFLALGILLAVVGSWQPATSTPVSPAVSPAPAAGVTAAGTGQEGQGVRPWLLRAHALPAPIHGGALPYTAAFNSSHVCLAVASANLSIGTINSLGGQIPSSTTEPSSGTLHDCAEAVASAADLAAHAAERLDGVEQVIGPKVLWRVRDAQTWLSATMTYEDTCTDALRLARSAPSPVRAELHVGVCRAMPHTSIALALVHMLIRTSSRNNPSVCPVTVGLLFAW